MKQYVNSFFQDVIQSPNETSAPSAASAAARRLVGNSQ